MRANVVDVLTALVVRRATLLPVVRSTTEQSLILLQSLRHINQSRRFYLAAPRAQWLHQMVGRMTEGVRSTWMTGVQRHLFLLYGIILVLLANDGRAHDVHLLL